jgi:hypothetical protein
MKYLTSDEALFNQNLEKRSKGIFMVVNIHSIMTWLTAQEDVTALTHCGSFKYYIRF